MQKLCSSFLLQDDCNLWNCSLGKIQLKGYGGDISPGMGQEDCIKDIAFDLGFKEGRNGIFFFFFFF